MAIRVILADDHKILRDGLRALLEAQPDIEVIGEAGDGLEALRLVELLIPHVVVVDIAMPRMNGLEATRRIKKEFPNCGVLILTQYDDREYVTSLVQSGANGYVLKNSAGSQLAPAIRAVHARLPVLDPMLPDVEMDASEACRADTAEGGVDESPLTDREREVLILIAEAYTNQKIGEALHISPKTVGVHRANIMTKLGLHNRTDLVKYAVRKGIVQVNCP